MARQPGDPPLRRSRKRSFSEDEDDLLLKLHTLLGNRWSLIAGRLPGRTDKEVMNHWNSKLINRMACTCSSDHPPSLPDDEHRRQRRRRRLRSEAQERGANHPGHNSSSSYSNDINGDDCTVADDASSCNQDDNRVAELNLELTLSTPCIYSYLLLGDEHKDGSKSGRGLI